jgi:predicted ATP-grasp superfamily ATP-dependent carboligase
MLPAAPRLLLVAHSARLLAQSAARGGFEAIALDLFGDADTRRYARHCAVVAANGAGFDAGALLAAARECAAADGENPAALVYGGGIDTHPELVEELARGRTLLGNAPAALRLLNAPGAFFPLLDELGIPYPDTRFAPPPDPEGWLFKPSCGEGGKGVGFFAENRRGGDGGYFQKHVAGSVCSLLFLVAGGEIRPIGFNSLRVSRHDPAQPFLFAGAINRANLDRAQRRALLEHARRLAAAAGLAGLNGLDFVVDARTRRALVLEVNPRPCASMALHDEDWPRGLLAAHVAACAQGVLPPSAPPGPVRAFRILYAPWRIEIREDVAWPPGCADIPVAGANVEAGEPLCSLMVEAGSVRRAAVLLERRIGAFMRALKR